MEGDEIGLEPVSGVQYPVIDHWVIYHRVTRGGAQSDAYELIAVTGA